MTVAAAIPISALEHFCYCPRQCALILVDGVWVDNEHTVRGTRGHQRADTRANRRERGRLVARGVEVWSERWRLSGRADAVEVLHDGRIVPVEYKIGRRHGDSADVQLCAQAMCLEEMLGVEILWGHVWYSADRRRRRVVLDERLRSRTAAIIAEVHAQVERAALPVAPNDERCAQCQLRAHCLPDVVSDRARVERYLADEVYRCAS